MRGGRKGGVYNNGSVVNTKKKNGSGVHPRVSTLIQPSFQKTNKTFWKVEIAHLWQLHYSNNLSRKKKNKNKSQT